MEKYFLFLKKPFSFKGRFNKMQYLISLLITLIFSFILTVIVISLFEEGGIYPEPSSLVYARKKCEIASNKYYEHWNYDTNDPEEIQINERLKRDEERTATIYFQEEWKYRDNEYILILFFIIVLNIPVALFLIASGTKRSHDIGDSGILQIALPIYIWVLLFKNSVKSENLYGAYIFSDIKISDNKNKIETMVSDNCPNCKNPNTQNLKICEWCGNQIV
jgi:uncharacterized membrane protein YhaH (DUF805 family)